jgi:primase-polymerase (primpol)-like protein
VSIPDDLRALPQWVIWRTETIDGRPTKVPYSAKTGRKASSTDRETWTSYDVATRALATKNYAGVGFVLTPDDPFTVVDLDHCIDKHGDVEPTARETIKALDSYTESSPSGDGVHVWLKATLPGDKGKKAGDVETYNAKRFMTVTGNHLAGTPETIEARQTELDTLYARVFPKPEPIPPKPRQNTELHLDMADSDVVERARKAVNGGKFERLMAGDFAGYPSQSEADQALCNLLAFWSRDDGQIDRIFRSSGLIRDKWDTRRGESTYGAKTISNALATVTEYYTPRPQKPHVDAEFQDDMATASNQWLARIEALEAQVTRLEEENTRLKAAIAENAKRASLETQALRNKALKPERDTVIALAREVQHAVSTGKVSENESVPIFLDQLAESAGKSPQSVSANLKRLEERGLLKREYVQEMKRETNPETGEVLRKYPVTRLLVNLEKPVTEFLADCATYEPEPEEKQWGGKRIVCPKHPHAGVIITKTVECAECGDVLHREVRDAASYTPPRQDDMATESDDSPPENDPDCGLRTIGTTFDMLEPTRINPEPARNYCSGCGTELRTPDSQANGYCATCRAGGSQWVAAGGDA